MSLDSRLDRLMADEQLDTACQAITASVAMLRATELQLHEIQDRQGCSPEEATLLCEQVVALRDLLKLRLGEIWHARRRRRSHRQCHRCRLSRRRNTRGGGGAQELNGRLPI